MPDSNKWTRFLALACGAIASACAREQVAYRGAGLPVDTLPPGDMVGVYRAALAGAFTLSDPTLSILVDPVLLPRSQGLAGGDTMPSEVRSALLTTGLAKGTCRTQVTTSRVPLICRAERAGYVARFSEPFALGGGDSVQVHLVVQQYAIQGGPLEQRLRFERAYHVVKTGSAWRAVREARMQAP
ncbi:MAG: hypothetical protein WD825_11020 [Gemmatimonadaceae bacterium]